MISRLLSFVLLSFLIISCNNKDDHKTISGPGKDQIEELNRYLIKKDRERIQNYIERKGLAMIESPTGLWYQIINEGTGEKLKDNDHISLDYECSLLDGTFCYSSAESGPMQLTLGRTSAEPGLMEGLKMIKPSGEAIFIIPPFLAHGLPGDGKKIPPRSVIVYRIKVLSPGQMVLH
jgi:FKBP-type peptidyl-prolyl cis-trans isomerase